MEPSKITSAPQPRDPSATKATAPLRGESSLAFQDRLQALDSSPSERDSSSPLAALRDLGECRHRVADLARDLEEHPVGSPERERLEKALPVRLLALQTEVQQAHFRVELASKCVELLIGGLRSATQTQI